MIQENDKDTIDITVDRNGKEISVELTNSAKDYLITNGYDAVYGARPLKRFVQKKLETLIAKNILANKILPNTTITVDCKDDELFIK